MSYDLMVFNQLKVPCEIGALNRWFRTHMENDVLPDAPPVIFNTFLDNIKKVFPSMNHCPENKLEYACDYEVHEDFIYMCFAYSVAKEAHDIVKRQAKIDNIGFWEVSQSFDRTFPITLPTDKWPMILEAKWIKYGSSFVYDYGEVRKILMQMKTIERSSICLIDRFGNYIQAGGYKDTFIVEVCKYIDAITYEHFRTQVLSKDQVCQLFQEFTDEVALENLNIFYKRIEI